MGNIQLVIPMAGLGSRFRSAGYRDPKPLLSIHGIPMYKIVVANLFTEDVESLTIVVPAAWKVTSKIKWELQRICENVNVIEIDYTTDGPADTVALAKDYLSMEKPLVIANSDQYVGSEIRQFFIALAAKQHAGLILCMEDSDPKWSYVELNSIGEVCRVVEKEVISNLATIGVYGFSKAELFFRALGEMKKAEDTVNGEWYVAPTYNYLDARVERVRAINLGPVSDVMFGMGIPTDYENFLTHPISEEAASAARKLFYDDSDSISALN